MIAFMVEALGITRRHRVLEIGTGSGYQTAILSLIAKEVYSIERIASLSQQAERTLKRVERGRIRLKVGDGSSGWQHYAPFDRIIVSAAMQDRPETLLEQLCDRGVLIGPVNRGTERLVLFSKEGCRITARKLSACAFVPLKKGVV
jgi:protein-L-isoaspartate(D-aspartate) O-methyltransferase